MAFVPRSRTKANTKRWRSVGHAWLLAAASCLAPPELDLESPQIIDCSVEPGVAVPVWPMIEVAFSEVIDPVTLSAGHVAVLAWSPTGTCDVSTQAAMPCADGQTCWSGTCWRDPATATVLAALERGEFNGNVGLELSIADSGAVLTVVPHEPLIAHTPHALVIGAGVRDREGAPLIDETGQSAPWSTTFVTMDGDSSGPVSSLAWPRAGERGASSQLALVDVAFSLPVVVAPDNELRLVAQDGRGFAGIDPVVCPGVVDGRCIRWHVTAPLPVDIPIRLHDVAALDDRGRPPVPPRRDQWFELGDASTSLPALEAVATWSGERCVFAQVDTATSTALRIEVADRTAVVRGTGQLRTAVPLGDRPSADGGRSMQVALEALSGATLVEQRDAAIDPSFDLGTPRLAIVEVLADPLGAEPTEEFVELRALADHGVVDDVWLADMSWPDVLDRLDAGLAPPGDRLPSFAALNGERIIVVAAGFVGGQNGDALPAAGTTIVRVDGSLGDGGLKNAGEPLSLYLADPPTLISSYTPRVTAPAGTSVVRRDAHGCDVAGQFEAHPGATASPGV